MAADERGERMQGQLVWVLWGLASGYGLWQGLRLAFFPIAMQATVPAAPVRPPGPSPAPEVMSPIFFAAGLPLLIALIGMYLLLGYTLYCRHNTAFRLVAGVHIIVSMLGGSSGWWLLPSSALLLLAILELMRLPPPTNGQQEVQRNSLRQE